MTYPTLQFCDFAIIITGQANWDLMECPSFHASFNSNLPSSLDVHPLDLFLVALSSRIFTHAGRKCVSYGLLSLSSSLHR